MVGEQTKDDTTTTPAIIKEQRSHKQSVLVTIKPVIPFFWALQSPLLDDRPRRAEDFWRSQQLEKKYIDVNDEGGWQYYSEGNTDQVSYDFLCV